MKSTKHKWQNLVENLNKWGIPLPMIKDPKTGAASVSLTLLCISAMWVQLSLVGKIVKTAGGLDSESAIYWFCSCAALYFGRKLSGTKSAPTLDAPTASSAPKEEILSKVDSPD